MALPCKPIAFLQATQNPEFAVLIELTHLPIFDNFTRLLLFISMVTRGTHPEIGTRSS
jgi:hypothetical protein